MSKPTISIMWFRRDLRLDDNAALYYALRSGDAVLPIFIFDKNILDDLEDKHDRRIQFIYSALLEMQATLEKHKSSIEVYYGAPLAVYESLLEKYAIKTVYANEDYEQYAINRDNEISKLLRRHNGELKLYKDQVIFSKDEVVKQNGQPYTVFTPYSKAWKALLTSFYLKSYPTEQYFNRFYKQAPVHFPSLKSMGFEESKEPFPPKEIQHDVLCRYGDTRNIPALENGTSRLGVHLRFGTISIRKLATAAYESDAVFLNELIWRDFYQMVLWQSDRVRKGQSFKPAFDNIVWRNNEEEFQRWCTGNTGYPIVDAGMRQLNTTGYMHNRVRMITASFLSKHLLIDWRWGEAYFAKKLLDYDYAANNGGWQWSAGTGCDASPYFRVFNPTLQTQKFDKQLAYIKHWVPEYQSLQYQPMVNHEMARQRALKAYKQALGRD